MAIYRLALKNGKAGTAEHHFAYVSREGKYAKGTKKEDLIAKESRNLPSWARQNPGDFWHECKEGFKKIELALPRELSRVDQIVLVRRFCEETFGSDFAHSWAIHENTGTLSGERNPHAHILFSERKIEHDRAEPGREEYFKKSRTRKDGSVSGGYRKSKEITGKQRREWLLKIRKKWEKIQNRALQIAGQSARVDCRRKEEYAPGSTIPAQTHLGAKRARMQRGAAWEEYIAIKKMPATSRRMQEIESEIALELQKTAKIDERILGATSSLEKAINDEIEAKKREEEQLRAEQKRIADERKAQEAEAARLAAAAEAARQAAAAEAARLAAEAEKRENLAFVPEVEKSVIEKGVKMPAEQASVTIPAPEKEVVPARRNAGAVRHISTMNGEKTTLYENGLIRMPDGNLYEVAAIGKITGEKRSLFGSKYEVKLPNSQTFEVPDKAWSESERAMKEPEKKRKGLSFTISGGR